MYFLHHLTISAKLWESPQYQSLLRTCREPVCFELRHLVVKKNKLALKQSCWCFSFRNCSLCLFTSLSPLCQQQTNQSRMSIAGSDSHSTAETEHLHLEGHVSNINSAEKPPTPGLFFFFFKSISSFFLLTLQAYLEARTYIIVEIALFKPLVPKTTPEELARR